MQRYKKHLEYTRKIAPRGDFLFGLCRLRRGDVRFEQVARLRRVVSHCEVTTILDIVVGESNLSYELMLRIKIEQFASSLQG